MCCCLWDCCEPKRFLLSYVVRCNVLLEPELIMRKSCMWDEDWQISRCSSLFFHVKYSGSVYKWHSPSMSTCPRVHMKDPESDTQAEGFSFTGMNVKNTGCKQNSLWETNSYTCTIIEKCLHGTLKTKSQEGRHLQQVRRRELGTGVLVRGDVEMKWSRIP